MNRVSLTDTTLPVGGGPDGKSPIYVPKGTMFDTSYYVLHRLHSIWGPSAEIFDPDRWDTFKPGAWEFLPFGAGPRGYVHCTFVNIIVTRSLGRKFLSRQQRLFFRFHPSRDLFCKPNLIYKSRC